MSRAEKPTKNDGRMYARWWTVKCKRGNSARRALSDFRHFLLCTSGVGAVGCDRLQALSAEEM